MFRRVLHFRTYREIDRAIAAYDWETATRLAKQIGDEDLHKAFALARVVQLLNPDAPQRKNAPLA